MISVVASSEGGEEAALVLAALRRSVGQGQAAISEAGVTGNITVLVGADDDHDIGELAGKLIVFGGLPAVLRRRFDATVVGPIDPALAEAPPAPVHGFSESAGVVQYTAVAAKLGGREWRRPLARYDFTREWNNHGYGAIRGDGSIWGLGSLLDVPSSQELAALVAATDRIGSTAALFDLPALSVLWFSRPAGPIDSFEWRLVENFLSAHRAADLPVQPVLSEIPFGYDMLVTMRLDFDEDLESARGLWAAYRDRGVLFSGAIHTAILTDGANVSLLRDIAKSGGAVLSHSATHPHNWGGSYEAALSEARASADRLEAVTGMRPRYAVSPFHESPAHALAALRDAGYTGCVGGNIIADPAFNLARGGVPAGVAAPFVGQSQQCMLHGDCLLAGDDPIATYREAFELARETRSIFAYLDHPFSARYQYGWADEASRTAVHMALIDHIAAVARHPLHLSMEGVLDFLALKSQVEVSAADGGFRIELPANATGLTLCAEHKGQLVALSDGMVL